MTGAEAAIRDGHEQVILSALMNGSPDLPVSSDDFSSSNKMIYHRIQSLTGRGLLAVTDALRRNGELEKVGGAGHITEIALLPHDDASVDYALGEMLDASRQRQAAKIGEQLHKGDITLAEALPRLSKLSERRSGLPPIEDTAELISKPLDLPDDVIEGVLHRGAKMVLGGASKSFKTWTLTDLAISVATGTDWLGKFATHRGRVLYINLELPRSWFTKRVRIVCDERQINLESGYLKVWNLRGYAADLSKLLPELLREIAPGDYVLIIVDPIYKLLGARDENKAGDIAGLLNEIESLAVKTGAAVAFGAHYSKGNQSQKEVIDRIGGSGVFSRDPDSILNFTRHEAEDCFTVDATLRNHPPITPFVVRWEYPLMCVESALDPARLKQSGAAVKQFHAAQLSELLTRPMSAADFRQVADDETGMSRSTFFRLFGELKESGTITPDDNGKWKRT
jgi:hypothetical protein